MSDGATVRAELDELTTQLDELGKAQAGVQEDFDHAAEIYDDIFNDLMVAFIAPYEEADGKLKRLPGEDVRSAIITKQMREDHPLEYGQYRRLKNELERCEKKGRRLEKMIFSKQSSLSWLKTEVMAAG